MTLGKSEIFLVGEIEVLEELARVLCCKVGSLRMNYLGMPLGSSFKAQLVWNAVVEQWRDV